MEKNQDEIVEIPEIKERVREEKPSKLSQRIKKEKNRKSTFVKDFLLLAVVAVFAGILLAGTYELMTKPIEKQDKLISQKLYEEIFSEGTSFREVESDYKAVDQYLKKEGYSLNRVQAVVEVKDSRGNVLGNIYEISSREGVVGDMEIALGINGSGVICGIKLLDKNTTTGLIVERVDESLLNQFLYAKAQEFSYTTTNVLQPGEINIKTTKISTAKAVIHAVNAGVFADIYYTSMEGGGENE